MNDSYPVVTLWIPDPASCHAVWHDVLPGSAVVSTEPVGTQVLCYLEGNLYGAANVKTYADRVLHASSRLRTGYPTSAVRSIPRSELLPVGTFDDSFGEVVLRDGTAAQLASWIGVPEAGLAEQLLTTDSAHALAARTLREMEHTTQGRLQADWLRRHGPKPYRSN